MKERPILFSAPMVRAILEGRKTVTRRVVKPQPSPGHEWAGWCVSSTTKADEGKAVWAVGRSSYLTDAHRVRCPYGQPGDRLWVKETFFAWGRWETRYSAKKGRDEWHFIDMTQECGKDYLYAADGVSNTQAFVKRRSSVVPVYWKRPAIFMPRHASRITLEVTGVRVERLQDISESDAIAEGMRQMRDGSGCWVGREGPGKLVTLWPTARCAFRDLWESINGAGSWDANPCVWVIEFKRVTP